MQGPTEAEPVIGTEHGQHGSLRILTALPLATPRHISEIAKAMALRGIAREKDDSNAGKCLIY